MREHSTFNIRPPTSKERVGGKRWGVRRSRSNIECFRLSWRAIVFATFFTLPVVSISLRAQTNAASPSSDRHLFIVDTSAAMRRNAPIVEKVVGNLLLSSMQGQLHRGDTVGLWTYNEQLYAGRLPLQQWTPEGEQVVATNILAFLKKQPYEKKPRFSQVLPVLQRVVRESERITVLLIMGGDEMISGTPFDRQINQFFQKHYKAQQKARAPFVIVLRARRGGFTSATLNLAQWPVEFSPFPPEPKKTIEDVKPKPPPPKPTPTNPPPTAPPLIIIGKKPEGQTTNTTTSTESSATATNLSSPAKSESPPVSPAIPPSPTEAAPAAAATTPQPTPDSSVPAAPAVAPPPVESKPNAVESPKPPPTPAVTAQETAPVSPPVTAAATEPAQVTATSEDPTPAVAAKLESPALVEPPAGTPPAQVATATAPEKPFKLAILLSIVTALLVLAVIGYFLTHRRTRAHASLITRSLDQDGK